MKRNRTKNNDSNDLVRVCEISDAKMKNKKTCAEEGLKLDKY